MKLSKDAAERAVRETREWLAAERDRVNLEHFGEYVKDHAGVGRVLGVVGLVVIVLFFVVVIP